MNFANWFLNITYIHENVPSFWLDLTIKKEFVKSLTSKTAKNNLSIILSGGSKKFLFSEIFYTTAQNGYQLNESGLTDLEGATLNKTCVHVVEVHVDM